MAGRHHRGTHPRRAAAIVATAYANPTTRCSGPQGCGRTLAEGIALWGEHRARWTAGHLIDGQIEGQLVAQHAHCNFSDGARQGNSQRRGDSYRHW